MIQWCTYIQTPRQGTSHKMQGNSPCQDMAVVKENDNVIAAVLSDGLGQLEYSQMAADAVTESVSTCLLKYDYKQYSEIGLKDAVLAECKRALKDCAASSNISISEMDCTLLFVVLLKDSSYFICGQLGDGAICIVNPNQGSQVMELNDQFKATSNLTKTVLSKDAKEYFNVQRCSANDHVGFFLTTDGLENELYSKAGKVKKKAEWYFNLISNNGPSVCNAEIQKRWNELASKEEYGFTDDMSLIAIVKPNTRIELPEEANWLCACGNRNRLESTRCESCGKDFLKIYKGINFKKYGKTKLDFFSCLNAYPQEELRTLQEFCEYPLEFPAQRCNEALESYPLKTSASLPEQAATQDQSQKTAVSRLDTPLQPQPSPTSNGQKTTKPAKLYDMYAREKNRGSKLNIYAGYLIAFMLGIIFTAFYIMAIKGYKDYSKVQTEVLNLRREKSRLQRENDSLAAENSLLIEKIELLNTSILEPEYAQSKMVSIPNGYDYFTFRNGEVYIGQLSQGFPNGTGVVYSPDMVMVGCFQNRMKNGDFYVLYNDGHSEICTYENDVLVSESDLPADDPIDSDRQSDGIGASPITDEPINPDRQSDGTETLPITDETTDSDTQSDGGEALPNTDETTESDTQSDGGEALPVTDETIDSDTQSDGTEALPNTDETINPDT